MLRSLPKRGICAALVAVAIALSGALAPAKTYGQTPQAPKEAETHSSTGDTTTIWLFAILGMGALAFGVGGVTVARRSR